MARNKPSSRQNAIFYSILKKTRRYSFPAWHISTFKRSYHSTLLAKSSARHFLRRNMPNSLQNAIFISILSKTKRYFIPAWDISTVKRSYHSTLHAERSKSHFLRRNRPNSWQNAIFYSILKKDKRYFVPAWDISAFKCS
jgi:hypothetical protein